jgi:hypothetical protein
MQELTVAESLNPSSADKIFDASTVRSVGVRYGTLVALPATDLP